MTADQQRDDARQTPLRPEHERLAAAFTEFAGFDMPVRYSSDLAEHRAVREAVGIFDLSHMGEIFVRGEDAGALLDYALAGTPSAMSHGKARYNLMLADDGTIIDDLIVYRFADDDFMVVANAGNRDTVAAELAERSRQFTAQVHNESDDWALIAVQGPLAERVLSETAGFTSDAPLSEITYYRADEGVFEGARVIIARTGYTGEDGFELFIGTEHAADLWRALEAAGEPHGMVPCGLACRDTLRLEAGMPLYGHELTRETKPAEAGVGRVVSFKKPGDFVGRRALEADAGDTGRALVGLTAEGKRAPRAGYQVLAGDEVVGEITSGALSPTLGHPVAMGFVDTAHTEPGTQLVVDVRGTRLPVTVVTLPFYKRKAA